MKRPFAHACVGLALAACLGTIVAALATAQQASESGDPIELFTKMVPVFTHDRCANCHGGVDPHAESGPLEDTHDGGIIPAGGTCADSGCHTQTNDGDPATKWQTAAPHHSFGGKRAKELCDMQSPIARRMRPPEDYFHHLESDFLIDLAFVGESGGANTSSPATPPMKKADFLKAAREWLDAGAGCGGWTGLITQKETFGSNYEYPLPGGIGTVQVTETAGRDVTIKRADGVTTGTFKMSGHQTIVQTMNLEGGPNGTCSIVTTSVGDWLSTTDEDSDASVTIHIEEDGGYTIRFVGPVETTRSNDTGHMVNDCGISIPAAPENPPTDLTWKPRRFTIRCPSSHGICQMFDPDNQRVSGTMERIIKDHSDAADRQSWLTVSPVGISRADDGASLPVTVTTTWDLTLTN